MEKDKKSITAKDLVLTLIELDGLLDKDEKLNPPLFADNTSRHYRYLQIMAIQEALGMNESLTSLIDGDFIKNREYEFYPGLKTELETEKIIKRYGSEKLRLHPVKLIGAAQFSYRQLMAYRINIHRVLSFWSSSIIGEPLYMLPYYMTQKINSQILKQIDVIDNKLAYFIDPNKKQFKRSYLVKQFHYPDVDIQMVDIDNF